MISISEVGIVIAFLPVRGVGSYSPGSSFTVTSTVFDTFTSFFLTMATIPTSVAQGIRVQAIAVKCVAVQFTTRPSRFHGTGEREGLRP